MAWRNKSISSASASAAQSISSYERNGASASAAAYREEKPVISALKANKYPQRKKKPQNATAAGSGIIKALI